MKKLLLPTGAVLLFALFVTGCESDGSLSGRAKEKSAVYTSLKPWQKKYIDRGAIAVGFSPDMVYLAMGNPTSKEAKDLPQGHAELWTFARYFPAKDELKMYQRGTITLDSAFHAQSARTKADVNQSDGLTGVGSVVQGPSGGNKATNPGSISGTGGVQGGSMEPADLQSYTVEVLFEEGRVVRMGAHLNN